MGTEDIWREHYTELGRSLREAICCVDDEGRWESYSSIRSIQERWRRLQAMPSLSLAWHFVCVFLRKGELVGHGFLPGEPKPTVIDPAFFRDSTPDYENNTVSRPGLTCTGVRIFSAEEWQARQRTADTPAPKSAVSKRRQPAKAAIEAWFKKRVDGWPDSQPFPSGDKDFAAAREAFPGISRKLLRSARKQITPPEWRKPGPRPKP